MLIANCICPFSGSMLWNLSSVNRGSASSRPFSTGVGLWSCLVVRAWASRRLSAGREHEGLELAAEVSLRHGHVGCRREEIYKTGMAPSVRHAANRSVSARQFPLAFAE